MKLHYSIPERRRIIAEYDAAPIGQRAMSLPEGVDRNCLRRWRPTITPRAGEVCRLPSQPDVYWTIEDLADGRAQLVRVDDAGAIVSTEVALVALEFVEVTK